MKQSLLLGVVFSLLSALCYALQTSLIKLNGIQISVPVLVFIQSLLCLILIIPILLFKFGRSCLNPLTFSTIKKQHILRSVFSLGISYFLFLAIKKMPYFDAVLIYNAFPLFIPLIASIILGSALNKKILPYIIIGFIGVTLTMNFDHHIVSANAFIALGSAVSAALSIVMMRKISAKDNSLKSLYYYFLISTLLSAFIAWPEWQSHMHLSWLVLLIISMLFFFVQYFLVLGATFTTPSVVSGVYYSNIIFSMLFSYFLLENALSAKIFIGFILIMIGGIGVIFLQKKSIK